MDPRQLLDWIVRPALRAMGPRWSTPAAEQLVMGTAAQESALRLVRQFGRGPGRGLWQMEPPTMIWLRDVVAPARGLAAAVNRWTSDRPGHPDELMGNFPMAAAYARLRYIASPRPLPAFDDIRAQAEEWKTVYNTWKGKGTVDEYLGAWSRLIAPARLWT